MQIDIVSKKFSMFNIHSLAAASIEQIQCGQHGDILAWQEFISMSDHGAKPHYVTNIYSSYQICQPSSHVVVVPVNRFSRARQICEQINGEMFYNETFVDDLIFLHIISDEGEKFV